MALLLLAKNGFAQQNFSMSFVLSRTPVTSLPFNATKYGENVMFEPETSYSINNSNNAIPDKLYDNVQCTQYIRASSDPYMNGCFFRKFAISGSSNKLVVVSFGGLTPYRTDVLCVVDPLGTVISTLEGHVETSEVVVKQFRINAEGHIIISQIVPTTSVSIPFYTFTSFTGQRKDITYSINAKGQFVQVSEVVYVARTYTRATLENQNINIWQGGETVYVPTAPNDPNVRQLNK
ncbi:hypothetical protein FACS1894156_8980 [Bacteroidia bacterium]|nr:hypothetical protein FACS1894156_8980 [Bacteroidia bacterium]